MKVVGVLMSVAVAKAAHVVCPLANVIMNGVANTSEFKDTDAVSDSTFDNATQLAGGSLSYHDQFFKYTATCNGVGLIMVDGNANFTSIYVDVWTGTCGAPVSTKISNVENEYTEADITDSQVYFSSGGGRLQYITTNGTEYIIRVGTSSDANNTGEPGKFAYSITAACVVPASNNPLFPTPVVGNMTYFNSNVNGSVKNNCGAGNNVYFAYTAECTGDISFIIVPACASTVCDGFHGEDLMLGVYNYTLTTFDTATGPDVCQDDPAIISVYRNLSNIPAGLKAGLEEVVGGIVMGKKYLIQVSSWASDVAPFTLRLDGPYCESGNGEPEPTATSSAAVMSLSAVVGAIMLFM